MMSRKIMSRRIMSRNSILVTCLAGLLSISAALQAQQTAVVVRGDLEIKTNLPGVFVADDKDEIKMEPEKYSGDLIVTKILQEGVNVKQGDVLIEFDTDLLDESIAEAQNESTDANVELQKATAEYEAAKIDRDATLVQLKTELEFLELEVQAAIAKQSMELEKKETAISDAEYSLVDTRIDMETLDKLYRERNLQTSNSGDILMEREKTKIVNAEKRIVLLQKELAYFLRFDRSKDQLEKELEVDKKRAEIKKQTITLAAAVAENASVVVKAQRKMDTATQKVQGLNSDREQLRVVAKRDGVLFYGTTGQELPTGVIIFSGGRADVRKELRMGGRVKTHKVLLTVAEMARLSIKMSVSEDDIQHLKKGLKISVFPDAFPGLQFAGELSAVDQIATKISFASKERRFKVMGKCTERATQLRSGMNCRVEIPSAPIENAILVPVGSVFLVEGGDYVCFVQNGSDFEQRKVDVGFSNADFVQVKNGLEAGEVVSLQRPANIQ